MVFLPECSSAKILVRKRFGYTLYAIYEYAIIKNHA